MVDWFRSWHGAPSDTKLSMISKESGVPRAIVTAIWWEMLDYASRNNPRGSIAGIDYEIVSFQQNICVTQCNACNTAMRKRNMIGANSMLSGWELRQPKREDSSASRVEKHRQKTRVTQGNAYVTQCNAPEESRGDKKEYIEEDKSSSRGFDLKRLVEIWEHHDLPKVKILTETRKSALRGRMKDTFKNVDEWASYCNLIRNTPFLLGESSRGWKINIDWALKTANATKILEGYYAELNGKKQPVNNSNNFFAALARAGNRHEPQEPVESPGSSIETFLPPGVVRG